ncbi:hypothetical protein ABZV80_32255 [Streptomyces sp. NPDC005132]
MYAEAAKYRIITQDISVNHSTTAPLIQPTLDTGVRAMGAAFARLGT